MNQVNSPPPRRVRLIAGVAALAVLAAACGSGKSTPSATTTSRRGTADQIAASVASYELIAGRPQRFIVGVLRADRQRLVSFGTVEMAFAYMGTKDAPVTKASSSFQAVGRFLPIPGQHVDPNTPGPNFVEGSQGTGVYGAEPVTFDRAGFWRVRVTAAIAGRTYNADGDFEVVEHNVIPAPGDAAPKTENAVAGAAGVDPRSIDSRADATTPIPDAELHTTSIAAAIAAHRPLMVVVSTPTYCVSRFCGPITDSVEALAKRYGTRMAFVHLEVWKSFDAGAINAAAGQWIYPTGTGDAREPWAFTVGTDGVIKARFDNVATDDELQKAVTDLVGP
ncbi:MAG: hypothetical protein H0W70_00160 [Actinobacteria bacterium]|nr:hypothetical protein [Actinomycetota bacterium]